MALQNSSDLPLFGGKIPWNPNEWTSSDDRVRGGNSVSYLDVDGSGNYALFTGVLDIDTLGGAGFASQRTVGEDKKWSLSGYEYIKVSVKTNLTDDRKYTFILKDNLLPNDPDTGREQSTVSYEIDFKLEQDDRSLDTKIFCFKIDSLVPHYRGRQKDDAEPLKKDAIKRFSIMMRSHFGAQYGPFRLAISAITAVKKNKCLKSVSFVAFASSYGTFRSWNWQSKRKGQPLTRRERLKGWMRQHHDYVVLAGFCVTMAVVIVLFGLIDGHRGWPRRPTPPALPPT